MGNGRSVSALENVIIENTSALEAGLLKLTGGVNIYGSVVNIKNTTLIETSAEDALNIINSDFVLDNLTITQTPSDALDSDFSNGIILSSSFSEVGGDAVDFSGSSVKISNTNFRNVRDKAVSAGEASGITARDITMHNVGVGIASKDGSTVKAKEISIQNFKLYAAMTYMKKHHYEAPSLEASDILVIPDKRDAFLAEVDTIMSVNQKRVGTSEVNVEKLYQTDVMRK